MYYLKNFLGHNLQQEKGMRHTHKCLLLCIGLTNLCNAFKGVGGSEITLFKKRQFSTRYTYGRKRLSVLNFQPKLNAASTILFCFRVKGCCATKKALGYPDAAEILWLFRSTVEKFSEKFKAQRSSRMNLRVV